MKKLIWTAMAATIPLMAQSSAELNINADDIEVGGVYTLSQGFDYGYGQSSNSIRAHYLYSGDSETRSENLFEAGFVATGHFNGLPSLRIGLGVKGSFSEDYAAIPIGVTLNYRVPVNLPITLGAEFYVAPSPLVFSDGDSYSSYRVELEGKLIPNASAYVGYRDIDLDYGKGSDNFNDGWYAGIRFYF